MKHISYITKKYTPLAILFLTAPLSTFAQVCSGPFNTGEGIAGALGWPSCIINSYLIPIAIGLEFILFIAGVIIYMTNGDNEAKRTEGNKFMMWGLVAIFITLSLWGLVAIIRNTLQI